MANTDITISTFNLRRDCASDGENRWRFRRESVAAAIRSLGADVIGVQEMTPVMKAELSALLPEFLFYGHSRCRGRMGEHNDLLVRRDAYEIEEWDTFWLSSAPTRPGSRALTAMFPRICTAARLRGRDGRSVRVLNTHFDHFSFLARSAAARSIRARLYATLSAGEVPTVLVGDLNARPDSRPVRILTADCGPISLRDAAREYAERLGCERTATFHFWDDTPDERVGVIDYIFVSPQISVERVMLCDRRFGGRYPSDHFPLTAKLVY